MERQLITLTCAACVGIVSFGHYAAADDVASFYSGKKLDFVIGSAPGGGYDVYGRLVVRHIARFIPGEPTVIPKNMPGGSSRVAAQHLFSVAAKDGTSIGMINQELPLAQALGDAGKYDTAKFRWIGSPDWDVRVVTMWHATGIRTIEDAKSRPLTMGTSGPTEATGYPEILNTLAGTRFRSVRGYQGGAAINLAMERGEVDGRADNAWSSWVGDHGDWVREKKIVIILQVGLFKEPDLGGVPLLLDLGRSETEKQALKLLSSPGSMGHPIVAPPGVPDQRLSALRKAFDQVVGDSAFLADAKGQGRPIRAVSGETLERIARDVLASSPEIVDYAKSLTK